jgi:hypothetical protein
MIKDIDIQHSFSRDKLAGAPLVFVIDGECLYNFNATLPGIDLFTKNKGITDISADYPEHDGATLQIVKENDEIEVYQTNEYFGSVLLSNPTVLDLNDYPYGHHVMSPDASFDGEKFIIKNKTVAEHVRLTEWHIHNPKNPNYVPHPNV